MTTRALFLAAVLFVPLALLPLRASAPSGSRADRADRRRADGGDPVAALASPVRSRTWDLAFWAGEHAAGTAVWRRALRACRSISEPSATSATSAMSADSPGCTAVRLASWWGPTPLPPPVWLLAAPFGAAGAEARQ
jgi:hypothetical protein